MEYLSLTLCISVKKRMKKKKKLPHDDSIKKRNCYNGCILYAVCAYHKKITKLRKSRIVMQYFQGK